MVRSEELLGAQLHVEGVGNLGVLLVPASIRSRCSSDETLRHQSPQQPESDSTRPDGEGPQRNQAKPGNKGGVRAMTPEVGEGGVEPPPGCPDRILNPLDALTGDDDG